MQQLSQVEAPGMPAVSNDLDSDDDMQLEKLPKYVHYAKNSDDEDEDRGNDFYSDDEEELEMESEV